MWKFAFIIGALLLSTSLRGEVNVLSLAGSTREDSVNKKLVALASSIARTEGVSVTLIDLKDYPLPLYDGDLEADQGMPLKAKQLRKLMIQSDVIFIASPEFNGSVSGVLKNVIDWASRSETGGSSRDAFKGKKFVLMSASPSPKGGAGGLNHLRSIIESIGGTVIPEHIAVPSAYSAFDKKGQLKDPQLKADLQQLIRRTLK